MYVSVKYRNDAGEYVGKGYTYKTSLFVKPGDLVIAPTFKGESPAMVDEVNIPDGKIDIRFIGKLREITKFYKEGAPDA